jgi:hypothetical protein
VRVAVGELQQIAIEPRAKVEEFQRKHRIGLLTLLFTDIVDSTVMRTITLEEHFAYPGFLEGPGRQLKERALRFGGAATTLLEQLCDLGEKRIAEMDAGGRHRYPSPITLLEVGVERIMFSADYPYASMTQACVFLNQLPVSTADKERIAHSNAERLFGL